MGRSRPARSADRSFRTTDIAVVKKALQIVTSFGVLLAAYAGYVRLFAIVAAGIGPAAPPSTPFVRRESATQQEATETASRAFGPKHWSCRPCAASPVLQPRARLLDVRQGI